MVMQAKHVYTPEEYLALERAAEYKSEYLNGEIYAMSGGTPAHAEIPMSIGSELRTQLKGKPCHVFSSDLKVKTGTLSLFAYPDVSVVCGDLQFHDLIHDVITNPIVIVEVLSDSTEAYDRGRKFFEYRQIDSLMDYLLVSQKEPYIDHYARQQDGRWVVTTVTGLSASLTLASIDCTLKLAEVYDKINFVSEEQVAGLPVNGTAAV